MKGNPQILEGLNSLLADELTAINQYMVHSESCANWGYERLHKAIEKRAIDEMRHAERLIGRIIFLEGKPTVSNLRPMHIGADVADQLSRDYEAEAGAVAAYNSAIAQAAELGDHGTKDLLQHILEDEEAHIDWLETQQDQVKQMGIQTYLLAQVG